MQRMRQQTVSINKRRKRQEATEGSDRRMRTKIAEEEVGLLKREISFVRQRTVIGSTNVTTWIFDSLFQAWIAY
jgi:hypothetical protein